MAMIEIENLTRRFGPVTAVAGLSLEVARGEVLGFLGPNGAGKSTTMKMVTGFLTPDSGTVRICGHDIGTDRLLAQKNIGYLPEGAPAYGEMMARDFLAFIAQARGFRGAEARRRVESAVEKTQLRAVLDRPIEALSKGFKRRVGLAQAILHDPPVLIMDEPTDGLDPNQKHAVRELIRDMAAQKAIIVSTHLLEEVEAICSRAVIIDRGVIVADGTPGELLARSRFHNAVTLTLGAADVERAASRLGALPAVAGLERSEARLTLFPRNGALLIEQVSATARNESWEVKELYAEPGRLDEVFRAITTQDTAHAP
jgi:ABC-2 type transport system ATP-binding protein